MAPVKKLHREKEAYTGYQSAAEEEFGDVLWYFAALARRLGHQLPDVLARAAKDYTKTVAASDTPAGPIVYVASAPALRELDDALLELGRAATELLILVSDRSRTDELLDAFARSYLQALQAARLTFSRVVNQNIAKTRGRFLEPDRQVLPVFDSEFGEDERLPSLFEIHIRQRKSGQSYLQWNGVFIGNPLTDNILDPDGYRFHDVFHFAHAAVLHWSPTFRALIKHKRKSDTVIDEASRAPRFLWTAFCEKENELCPRENSTRLRPRREPGGRPQRPQPRGRSSARGGGPRDEKSPWSSRSSRGNHSRASVVAMA